MVQAEMLAAFKTILASPFRDLSVWWYLTPVIILWCVLEVYFGEHKQEKLGWNTALGNGMSLTWINIESMRYLFQMDPQPFWLRFFFILLILVYGGFLIYISFTHKFSPKATYALAAPTPIYFFSTVSILWGHGSLDITWWVLLDLFLLFWIILGIFALIKRYLPERESTSLEPSFGGEEFKL